MLRFEEPYAVHLPDTVCSLVLRAALLKGEACRQAWEAWQGLERAQRQVASVRQILPLLYRNLQQQGVRHADLLPYKIQYVAVQDRNRLLFRTLAAVLQDFHSAGIRTLLLKGAALVEHYYEDAGLRPMGDVDLLIPPECAAAAAAILEKQGWKAAASQWRVDSACHLIHALHYAHPDGGQLDLHFHVFTECLNDGTDQELWQAARPLAFGGHATRILSPADFLLHVIVHGAKASVPPPIRWVADAVTILAKEQDRLDWQRLTTMAGKHGLVLPLLTGLRYLQREMDVCIPAAAVDDLVKQPVSSIERLEYRVFSRSFFHRSPWQMFLRLYLPYLRIKRTAGPEAPTVSFARYLQQHLGLRYLWQLPFYAAFKPLRRLFIMLKRRRSNPTGPCKG